MMALFLCPRSNYSFSKSFYNTKYKGTFQCKGLIFNEFVF